MAIGYHPSSPNTIFAASNLLFDFEGGVWKTTNQGVNWTPVSKGITCPVILSVAADPVDAQKIYAATGEPGSGFFYRSADGGQTWTRGYSEMLGGQRSYSFSMVKDLGVDPNNSQKIFLAGTEFYVSYDEGQLFSKVDAVKGPTDIAMPKGALNTIYVGSNYPGSGIYKSTNGGTTWASKNNGLPMYGSDIASVMTVTADPNNPNTLWAGTRYGGVARTNDGGDQWVVKGLGDKGIIDAIAVHPNNSNIVLVGASQLDGKIIKTRDGGNTWRVVIEEIGSVSDIVYDPRDSNWVYAFSELSGVLRSSDGGEHWFPYNNGIFYPMMYQGAFTAGSSPKLIAGSYGSGLYWISPDISELLIKPVYLPLLTK